MKQTTTASGAAALAVAAAAAAGPVTIDFEGLDQPGIYAGAGWDGMNTVAIDDLFAGAGIDFNGTASGWNHDAVLPGLAGADGGVSLVNAFRTAGVDTFTTIEMSAVGTTWDAFEVLALTTSGVTMSALDSSGGVLETIDLGMTLGSGAPWQTFAFSVGGIASVEISGAGGDVLIDTIRYEPVEAVLIPLPGSGVLGLAGLGAICFGSRRRY
ncbi:MAG: hypothetical protein AAFX79_08385 [Planctomycetota bacterium]